MSITNELREYVGDFYLFRYKDVRESLTAIADRIDAEHFNALVGRSEIGVQAVLSDPEQYGLVALPKDADGEVIHIGDVMEWIDLDGETLTVKGIGNGMLFYTDCGSVKWTVARNKRHYHEPTVEDVLREFADLVRNEQVERAQISDETVAEYAAKLRLAEGEDA